ncbi:unnamed protein product [Strongylus vulgaris]|uniref:Uncharacterized protein n=1 Tax=Strongylus vulgaris TaxID=40348 RepID=A0A3P7IWW1_STRVU|nr:unnamed protein product [Strongylus vulgaris]
MSREQWDLECRGYGIQTSKFPYLADPERRRLLEEGQQQQGYSR